MEKWTRVREVASSLDKEQWVQIAGNFADVINESFQRAVLSLSGLGL